MAITILCKHRVRVQTLYAHMSRYANNCVRAPMVSQRRYWLVGIHDRPGPPRICITNPGFNGRHVNRLGIVFPWLNPVSQNERHRVQWLSATDDGQPADQNADTQLALLEGIRSNLHVGSHFLAPAWMVSTLRLPNFLPKVCACWRLLLYPLSRRSARPPQPLQPGRQ